MNEALMKAATIAVRDCMGVKSNETVLVVTDDKLRAIGLALYEAALTLGAEAMLLEMAERENHGAEPPPLVAEAMQAAAAVLCPTAKSLTHTASRRNACEAGARVGTLPGITEECMVRCMSADYHAIADRTVRIADILDGGREARLTTAKGTDISMPIEGCRAIASTGLILEPGAAGNLPSGEAFLMQEEGKSAGIVVIDGAMAGVGMLEGDPITLRVQGGYAVEIIGGDAAKRLEALVSPYGQKGRTLAELGVGTNDQAKITGMILEDEKVMGTVHVALGNNMTMGGTCDVPLHLDGIITDPTLTVDGREILVDGKLVV